MPEESAEALPRAGEVWYVSYGSNMSSARLEAYLVGWCAARAGAVRTREPATRRRRGAASRSTCRAPSTSPATRRSGVAGSPSTTTTPTGGPTAARAYLVTAAQFADVAAQEMYRIPQEGDPLEEVVVEGIDGGRHHVGPGRYETLVEVGRLDGAPMLLFTSPHGIDHVEHSRPSEAYVAMLRPGCASHAAGTRTR